MFVDVERKHAVLDLVGEGLARILRRRTFPRLAGVCSNFRCCSLGGINRAGTSLVRYCREVKCDGKGEKSNIFQEAKNTESAHVWLHVHQHLFVRNREGNDDCRCWVVYAMRDHADTLYWRAEFEGAAEPLRRTTSAQRCNSRKGPEILNLDDICLRCFQHANFHHHCVDYAGEQNRYEEDGNQQQRVILNWFGAHVYLEYDHDWHGTHAAYVFRRNQQEEDGKNAAQQNGWRKTVRQRTVQHVEKYQGQIKNGEKLEKSSDDKKWDGNQQRWNKRQLQRLEHRRC